MTPPSTKSDGGLYSMEIDKDMLDFEQKMGMFAKLFLRFNRNVETKFARTAEEHFKENFELGGFLDGGLEPWAPRTSDLDPGRAILVKSGDLKQSIQGTVPQPGKIVISTDIVYARAHNEGVPERNLPQRKIIGHSKELDEKIKRLLKKEFVTSVKNKLK